MSLVKISGNASGTGTLTIAAPNTNSNYTLTLPTASGTFLTNSGTEAGAFSTLSVNSNNISAENSLGFRNRIINGDMRIDQRNAGASISLGSSPLYPLDRFEARVAQGSGHTGQRVSTAPVGFNNSLKITIGTGASPTAGQNTFINQQIEGFNFADLGWGTANAKTITVSFMVYSSLTGTFSYGISNSALNRSYVATYSISVANTWTTISLTIPGDTSGTWVGATNGVGSYNFWDLGSGSDRTTATAGVWVTDFVTRTSATVNLAGTSGATFYITGVQLEVGSVATPFERRPYGTELQLCQRYFYKYENTTGSATPLTVWQAYATTAAFGSIFTFPVVMRASPTATTSGTFFCYNASGGSALNFTAFNVDRMTPYTAGSNGSSVASGLGTGDATVVYAPNNGSISLTAEL